MHEEWTDQQLISHALNMWANYVETGNVSMSAKTAKEMNEEVNTLNSRKKELVDRMRKLAAETINDRS